jgi:hypothetical protein
MKIKRISSLILLSLLVSLFQSLPTANAAGPATQLVLTRPAVGTASGSAFTTQPQLTLQDASGNTVTGSALVISIQSFSFSGYMNSITGAETLIGTQTATIDASTGVATFPADFGISGIAGRTYSFNYYNATVAPASQSITVTAGAASKLILKRASAGTTSGIAFTTQPQISVADSGNNTVTGSTPVITALVSAGGTLVGTTTAIVDSGSGVATFNDLGISGTNNSSYTVTYSSTGLAPVTVSIKIGTPTAPGFPNYGGNSTTSTNSLLEYNFPAPDNGGSDITSYEYQWVTASSSAAATPTATWITYPAPEIQAGLIILSIDLSLLVRAVDPNWNYFLLRTRNAIGASSHTTTGYRLGFLGVPTSNSRTAPSSTTSIISGATLTNQMTFSGPAPITYAYEWQRCEIVTTSSCATITDATNSTYALTDADVGKYIRSRVIATNSYGSSSTGSSSRSSLTSIVLANSGPDITAPTITSVNATTGNGTYKVGDQVSIQVNFSENVTVTGTPKLTLETGSVDRAVTYASGTGTNQLTFTYTVQAGDTTADLDYLSTSALDLNGGTISDAAANNATLTLAAAGATNSLGANKAIVIDTTAPTQTVTNIDISADTGISTTDFTTFTAAQTVTGTLSANLGTGESLWGSVDGGTNYTNITSSVSGTSISWPSVTLSGSSTITLQLRDSVGNIGATATQTYELDATAPTQTVTNVDISTDTGSSATDFITATALQTITGTLSANLGTGESLWGSVDGGANYVNITTSVIGTAISWTGATLTSGSSSIEFQVRDLAGNAGATATQAYEFNSTTPTQTISSIDISTDTGSSATDFVTATASQTITGTLSANLRVGDSLWGSVDGGANYVDISSSVSGTAITWLNTTISGSNSINFQVRDTAGATGATATQTYVLDSTAPIPTVATVALISPTAVAVRSSEIGTAYLVKTTVTVSNLASITGAADDSMNQVAITAAATDTTMSTAGLIPGDYKLYVVDAAGNLSLASTNTVTIGVATAPTVTSTSAPTGTTTFGSTLTNAVTFTGLPTPTLTYQWKICTNATETATVCSDISGANGSSFIANAINLIGKFIRVLVTAVNGVSPDATEWSSPTGAIAPVAPGAPTLGTPTVGDLQISIPITAPLSNGGSTILKYQYSTDGGLTWMDRTDSSTVTSPIVIKYLSTNGTTPIVAGTAYPIQIRAVNSAIPGEGAASTSLTGTPTTSPGAPTTVSAVATGLTTATVSFVAPVSNGGSAITTYTVTASPGGVTASGSSSPIFVTGLTAATAYTFTVTATNALATSVTSIPSIAATTFSPPIPTPEPICNALCVAAQNAAIKAAADKIIADKAAADKIIADKIASDSAAKIIAEKVVVDKTAAEAAAKTAVEKAVAAAVSKAVADAAVAQAATAAKTAADAQLVAVAAAEKAAAALKNPTASAATKAAATKAAAKAATTASNTVKAAATAAKAAATARAAATNAQKQVEIALGALSSKTAAAKTTAQANVIAAAAKAAANKAAKAASDRAVSAKAASDIANKEAASASEIIVTKQKQAADTAATAKVANELAVKATEEKVTAAAEAQNAAEAVVKLLDEKIALADASVKAKDITERAAIDKKIEELNAKVADAQRIADAATVKAESTTVAQERTQAAASDATQLAAVQAAEAVAAATDSIAKTAVASKAQAAAKLAANVAKAAVAAAAKVPSRAVIAATSNSSTKKNTATATITGLKPGQKVKVTVNVKGK